MAEKICKLYGIDNGFCRVDYVALTKEKQRVYYCIQEECDGVFEAYRSTQDGEPQYPVKCDKEVWEVPVGDSTIEKNVRKFLEGGYDEH